MFVRFVCGLAVSVTGESANIERMHCHAIKN